MPHVSSSFRRRVGARAVVASLAFALRAAAAQEGGAPTEDSEPPVLPYRPSVSTPAQLPAPGQLELEIGGLDAKSGRDRRDSLPFSLKLAFDEKWGVVVGGEAFVSAPGDNGRARGVGDATLTLKRAFVVDDTRAFGLELTGKAPTAKDGIGSGRPDYAGNAIYSQDFGRVHMDANANLTRVGVAADDGQGQGQGQGRLQKGWAASFSTSVAERWDATAEWSGASRRGVDLASQALFAATWSPAKRLAIDMGFARGLAKGAPDWSFFCGAVMPLAKLW